MSRITRHTFRVEITEEDLHEAMTSRYGLAL